MRLLLVRHGETKENKAGIILGQNPGVLTTKGKQQALNLKNKILVEEIDAVYSSDLKRCKDTTKILTKTSDIPICYDPRLREVNFGDYQGKSYGIITDNYSSKLQKSFPNGESNADMISRVVGVINDVLKRHRDETILVSTHSGPISVILASYHNIPFKKALEMKLGNCELLEIELKQELNIPV